MSSIKPWLILTYYTISALGVNVGLEDIDKDPGFQRSAPEYRKGSSWLRREPTLREASSGLMEGLSFADGAWTRAMMHSFKTRGSSYVAKVSELLTFSDEGNLQVKNASATVPIIHNCTSREDCNFAGCPGQRAVCRDRNCYIGANLTTLCPLKTCEDLNPKDVDEQCKMDPSCPSDCTAAEEDVNLCRSSQFYSLYCAQTCFLPPCAGRVDAPVHNCEKRADCQFHGCIGTCYNGTCYNGTNIRMSLVCPTVPTPHPTASPSYALVAAKHFTPHNCSAESQCNFAGCDQGICGNDDICYRNDPVPTIYTLPNGTNVTTMVRKKGAQCPPYHPTFHGCALDDECDFPGCEKGVCHFGDCFHLKYGGNMRSTCPQRVCRDLVPSDMDPLCARDPNCPNCSAAELQPELCFDPFFELYCVKTCHLPPCNSTPPSLHKCHNDTECNFTGCTDAFNMTSGGSCVNGNCYHTIGGDDHQKLCPLAECKDLKPKEADLSCKADPACPKDCSMARIDTQLCDHDFYKTYCPKTCALPPCGPDLPEEELIHNCKFDRECDFAGCTGAKRAIGFIPYIEKTMFAKGGICHEGNCFHWKEGNKTHAGLCPPKTCKDLNPKKHSLDCYLDENCPSDCSAVWSAQSVEEFDDLCSQDFYKLYCPKTCWLPPCEPIPTLKTIHECTNHSDCQFPGCDDGMCNEKTCYQRKRGINASSQAIVCPPKMCTDLNATDYDQTCVFNPFCPRDCSKAIDAPELCETEFYTLYCAKTCWKDPCPLIDRFTPPILNLSAPEGPFEIPKIHNCKESSECPFEDCQNGICYDGNCYTQFGPTDQHYAYCPAFKCVDLEPKKMVESCRIDPQCTTCEIMTKERNSGYECDTQAGQHFCPKSCNMCKYQNASGIHNCKHNFECEKDGCRPSVCRGGTCYSYTEVTGSEPKKFDYKTCEINACEDLPFKQSVPKCSLDPTCPDDCDGLIAKGWHNGIEHTSWDMCDNDFAKIYCKKSCMHCYNKTVIHHCTYNSDCDFDECDGGFCLEGNCFKTKATGGEITYCPPKECGDLPFKTMVGSCNADPFCPDNCTHATDIPNMCGKDFGLLYCRKTCMHCGYEGAHLWNWTVNFNFVYGKADIGEDNAWAKYLGRAASRTAAMKLAEPDGAVYPALVWFRDDYPNETWHRTVFALKQAGFPTQQEFGVDSAVYNPPPPPPAPPTPAPTPNCDCIPCGKSTHYGHYGAGACQPATFTCNERAGHFNLGCYTNRESACDCVTREPAVGNQSHPWTTKFPPYMKGDDYYNPLSKWGKECEEDAVSKIDSGRVYSYIKQFTSIAERRWDSWQGTAATLRLLSREFTRLGLKVCEQKFSYSTKAHTKELTNLIAFHQGITPDYVVVGAHYDTQAFNWDKSPGAEDNGSGLAGLLAIARAFKLSGAVTLKSIYFVAFAGQKLGEKGSKAFVSALAGTDPLNGCRWGNPTQAPRSIIMDGISWVSPHLRRSNGDVHYTVNLESFPWAREIMDHMAHATTEHNGEGLFVVHNKFPYGSDHTSFLDAEWPAVLTTNGDDEAYPLLNNPFDDITQINATLGSFITKMNMATLLRLSGVLQPYHQVTCGGSIGGAFDCKPDVEWDQIAMPIWDANGTTLEACKAFCDLYTKCLGCAQTYGGFVYALSTWSFSPCDAAEGCGIPVALHQKSNIGAVDESLSSMELFNFNFATVTNRSVSYIIGNRYTCSVTGWTTTSAASKGFIRDAPGDGMAVVSGLIPGAVYSFRLYQYSEGIGTGLVYVNENLIGRTKTRATDYPSASGVATATGLGQISFRFPYDSTEIALSSIAIGKKASGSIASGEFCPWLSGSTLKDDLLECMDGTFCSTDWTCCKLHGGRARCPLNFPEMCEGTTVDGVALGDYTCQKSCELNGGRRSCEMGTRLMHFGCPWMLMRTLDEDKFGCFNGEYCDSPGCCAGKGGLAKCPPNKPKMCAQKDCGGDYCCGESCDNHGGNRQCDIRKVRDYIKIRTDGHCCAQVTPDRVLINDPSECAQQCSERMGCHYYTTFQETYEMTGMTYSYCDFCQSCTQNSTGLTGFNYESYQKYQREEPVTVSRYTKMFEGAECCGTGSEQAGSKTNVSWSDKAECEQACTALPDCFFFSHDWNEKTCKFCRTCDYPAENLVNSYATSWQSFKAQLTPGFDAYPSRLCASWVLKDVAQATSRAWCHSDCVADDRCRGFSWSESESRCILEGSRNLLVNQPGCTSNCTEGYQDTDISWTCFVRRPLASTHGTKSMPVAPLVGFDANRLSYNFRTQYPARFNNIGRLATIIPFAKSRMHLGTVKTPIVTVEAFLKLESASGMSLVENTGGNVTWAIRTTDEGTFTARATSRDAVFGCDCPVPAQVNTWTHVALTYDASASKAILYSDGGVCCDLVSLVDPTNTAPTPPPPPTPIVSWFDEKIQVTGDSRSIVSFGAGVTALGIDAYGAKVSFIKVYGVIYNQAQIDEMARSAHKMYRKETQWQISNGSIDCGRSKIQSLDDCARACASLAAANVLQERDSSLPTHCAVNEAGTCIFNTAHAGTFDNQPHRLNASNISNAAKKWFTVCKIPEPRWEQFANSPGCGENKIKTRAECTYACESLGVSGGIQQATSKKMPFGCFRGVKVGSPCFWNTKGSGLAGVPSFRSICKAAASPYELSEKGQDCPAGYAVVDDRETCQDAYSVLLASSPYPTSGQNNVYKAIGPAGNSMPRGCFVWNKLDHGRQSYFNDVSTAPKTQVNSRLVCKRARAPFWRLSTDARSNADCEGRWLVKELEFYEDELKHDTKDFENNSFADFMRQDGLKLTSSKVPISSARAFDGKTNASSPAWSSGRLSDEAFIGYGFNEPVFINRFRILQYPGCAATTVNVQFSENKQKWTTLWSQSLSNVHQHFREASWQDSTQGTAMFTTFLGHCRTGKERWPNYLTTASGSQTLDTCKNSCSVNTKCVGLSFDVVINQCRLWGMDYDATDQTSIFEFNSGNGGSGLITSGDGHENATCYAKGEFMIWTRYSNSLCGGALASTDITGTKESCEQTCEEDHACKGLQYSNGRCALLAGNLEKGPVSPMVDCHIKVSKALELKDTWSCYQTEVIHDSGDESDVSNFDFSSLEACQARCSAIPNCHSLVFDDSLVSGQYSGFCATTSNRATIMIHTPTPAPPVPKAANRLNKSNASNSSRILTPPPTPPPLIPRKSHVCSKVSLPDYLLGFPSSNRCPKGFSRIGDESECKKAADASLTKWLDPMSESKSPKGCFETNGLVSFNQANEAQTEVWGRPVCALQTCTKSFELNNFMSLSSMQDAGWSFNFVGEYFRPSDCCNERIPKSSWWGRSLGEQAGEISLRLVGAGRVNLDYGTGCKQSEPQKCSPTKVSLNGVVLDEAGFGVVSRKVVVPFKDGDLLKLREKSGVIVINSFEVSCVNQWKSCHGSCNKWPIKTERKCPAGSWLANLNYATSDTTQPKGSIIIMNGTCSDGTVLNGPEYESREKPLWAQPEHGATCLEKHPFESNLTQAEGISTWALKISTHMSYLKLGDLATGWHAANLNVSSCPEGWKVAGWKIHSNCAVKGLEFHCGLPSMSQDVIVKRTKLLSCCDVGSPEPPFWEPAYYWRAYLSMNPVPDFCKKSNFEANCFADGAFKAGAAGGACSMCQSCFDKGCDFWSPDQQSFVKTPVATASSTCPWVAQESLIDCDVLTPANMTHVRQHIMNSSLGHPLGLKGEFTPQHAQGVCDKLGVECGGFLFISKEAQQAANAGLLEPPPASEVKASASYCQPGTLKRVSDFISLNPDNSTRRDPGNRSSMSPIGYERKCPGCIVWSVLENWEMTPEQSLFGPLDGSVEVCKANCSATPGCKGFTYYNNYSRCFGKSELSTAPTSYGVRTKPDPVAWVRHFNCEPSTSWKSLLLTSESMAGATCECRPCGSSVAGDAPQDVLGVCGPESDVCNAKAGSADTGCYSTSPTGCSCALGVEMVIPSQWGEPAYDSSLFQYPQAGVTPEPTPEPPTPEPTAMPTEEPTPMPTAVPTPDRNLSVRNSSNRSNLTSTVLRS